MQILHNLGSSLFFMILLKIFPLRVDYCVLLAIAGVLVYISIRFPIQLLVLHRKFLSIANERLAIPGMLCLQHCTETEPSRVGVSLVVTDAILVRLPQRNYKLNIGTYNKIFVLSAPKINVLVLFIKLNKVKEVETEWQPQVLSATVGPQSANSRLTVG